MVLPVNQAASAPSGQADIQSLSHPLAGSRVGLRRIGGARLLWLNGALAASADGFCEANTTLDAYKARLVNACAFRVSAYQETSTHWGTADRYGGVGLNGNGGAGRAVLLNGYYIKGVGRTPLIGDTVDRGHASGDAYLEEACREAIFAELFASELPFGAVQTLAIIDTGEQAYWPEVDKYETKVLVVRKPFRRAGHFVRALGHRSLEDRSGVKDARRVDHHLSQWSQEVGPSAIPGLLTILIARVAMQLGYCFVHRLTHGSPTLSNIAIDGRLLDFGASSSLPSYARSRLSPVSWGLSFADAAARVINEFHDLVTQCERTLVTQSVDWSAQIMAAKAAYEHEVLWQTARLCGIDPADIESRPQQDIARLREDVSRGYRREALAQVDLLHEERALAWLNAGSPGLPTSVVEALRRHGLRPCDAPRLLCQPRPDLSREDMRHALYNEVDCRHGANAESVHLVIKQWVERNRRDLGVMENGRLPSTIGEAAWLPKEQGHSARKEPSPSRGEGADGLPAYAA